MSLDVSMALTTETAVATAAAAADATYVRGGEDGTFVFLRAGYVTDTLHNLRGEAFLLLEGIAARDGQREMTLPPAAS